MSTRISVSAGFILLFSASGALGQLTMSQKQCLNHLNADGAAVAKAQRTVDAACLKKAGAGTLVGTAQACLAVASMAETRKKNKTLTDETKYCAPPPSFGYTSGATVNTAAEQAALDLMADVFGANLDAAVIPCATSKPGCMCQRSVSGGVANLMGIKLATFVGCKKKALLNGATSVTSLVNCVNDSGTTGSIAAGSMRLTRARTMINTRITNKCDTPGVTAGAFPGTCTGKTGSVLGTCLDVQVECRVCQMINQMDGLFINCDLFDDGTANGSCASGSGPTPTPTNTPTQTPSPSPTATIPPGQLFRGALVATTGLFNYNAALGLPGSDAACTSSFGTSHTCTYAELQTADAANELVGAVDTSNNPVTSFWAVDPAQPADRQCKTSILWDYQTAHTGRGGDSVALTGGHLGTFTPGKTGMTITGLCLNTHWVGCCL